MDVVLENSTIGSEDETSIGPREEESDGETEEESDGETEEESGGQTEEESVSDYYLTNEESNKDENNLKDIETGESFLSYLELKKRVKKYEDYSHCIFYKRDCKTIEKARKIGVKRHIEPCLTYYTIQYHCVHGGKNFKSKATGQRSSNTLQKACGAGFTVNVSKDGMKLFVKNTYLDHNHEKTKELYNHYSRVRRMSPEVKEKAKLLVEMKANKTKIKNLISKETGKVVLLKDIHNLQCYDKDKNNLKAVENILKKYQAECHFLIDSNVFQGLFFATPQMKSAMLSWPEYIGIDGTFKLLDIRAPVYLFIVEDSNGSTEIVGVSILITETKGSIKWMMESFKKCHSSWKKIKCVMTDKDLTERDAIRESLLPLIINLIICAFHTLKSFNREITIEKRGINHQERDESKRILQKMVYAETEEHYFKLYEELKEMPESVLKYFNENWHECRKEWSISTDFVQHNFLNNTNNRLESLNGKLKKDLDLYSSLEKFILNLLITLECSQVEKDHRAATMYQKLPVLIYPKESAEYCYAQYLTNYAFKFIKEEFDKIHNLNLIYNEDSDIYQVNRATCGTISATSTSCDCLSYVSMNLPCRHILAVRKLQQQDLYEESLCLERWTKNYYFNNQRVFVPSEEQIPVPTIILSSANYKTKILSEHEKYKKANEVAKQLPALVAEVGSKSYIKRLKVLTDILQAWQNNEDVKIINLKSGIQKSNDRNSRKFIESHDDNISQNPINIDDNDEEEDASEILIGTEMDDNNRKDDLDDELQNLISYVQNSGSQSSIINEDGVNTNHEESDCEDTVMYNSINLDNNEAFRGFEPNNSVNEDNSTIEINNNIDSVQILASTSTDILSKVIVQPAIKRRGRPRGTDKTVIGLPKKKKLNEKSIVPFNQRSTAEKKTVILKWFLGSDTTVNKVLNNKQVLCDSDVKISHQDLPFAVLDEKNVDLSIIQQYFTAEGWTKILSIYAAKKQETWECNYCKLDLNKTVDKEISRGTKTKYKITVGCDCCLEWYHLKCIGLKREPRSMIWICPSCKNSKK